jgi:hypothetical protein
MQMQAITNRQDRSAIITTPVLEPGRNGRESGRKTAGVQSGPGLIAALD